MVKGKQGIVLTNPVSVKARLEEHFSELHNQVNSTDDTVLLEIPDDSRLDANSTDKGQSKVGHLLFEAGKSSRN